MELNSNLSLKAQKDVELVEKAKKGDQLAYGELLGRYRDAIYFMLLKMVNSPVDAEDLTIEAFGKAFKNIEQYTPNFAEDSLSPSSLIQSDTLDPELTMINKQKIKHMRKVVARLKPRYRQLVELRYFKEYSYDEIAVELDIPIGTVKAQLFRARELLLNILNRSPEKP